MDIAKPSTGFRVVLSDKVERRLSELAEDPRVPALVLRTANRLIEEIRQDGHRMGRFTDPIQASKRNHGAGERKVRASADDKGFAFTLEIDYKVIGDRADINDIRILSTKIEREN